MEVESQKSAFMFDPWRGDTRQVLECHSEDLVPSAVSVDKVSK